MEPSVEAFREAIAQELDKRNRIDQETHKAHHDYVANLIECSRRRREIFDAVSKQVLGWGLLIALGFIGKAVYEAATRGTMQ